ncbi:MAG: insulinase family protein [Chlamydiales bacterium]
MIRVLFCCYFLFSFLFSNIPTTLEFERITDCNTLPIHTYSLQNRKTSKLRLSNNLEVWIISDPLAEQSASALSVNVGSWQDPIEYPGTAHFLEHMLFLGTKKYPVEDEFMSFVSQGGGQSNAYTFTDRTVYAFSICHEKFLSAVDRFAQFFIDPLFNPSGLQREIHAINQENDKNLENDLWRAWMVFKETGNPKHPNHLFSTGNKTTLANIPRQIVEAWHKEHYSSDKMHLVLYSSLPLDVLEQLAVTTFSSIPNNEYSLPAINQPLMSSEQLGSIIYLEPIQMKKQIGFIWELPEELVDDDTHSASLLAYILQSRAQNSLFEYLQKNGLIEEISAGILRLSKKQALFQLEIEATQKGIIELDSIIKQTFAVLQSLQQSSIPRSLFEEQKALATLKYAYQHRINAFNYVMQHVDALLTEPLSTYPERTTIAVEYDPTKINKLLSHLKLSNCLTVVTAPESLTNVTSTHTEKWLGGKYTIEKLELSPTSKSRVVSENTGIPISNSFLPDKLQLTTLDKDHLSKPSWDAKLLTKDKSGILYFLQDKHYLTPKVACYFGIKTPSLNPSPYSHMLFDLFLISLQDKLAPMIYQAKKAGIKLEALVTDLQLQVIVEGYSDKIDDVIINAFDTVNNFSLSPEKFTHNKEKLLQSYYNRIERLPLFLSHEVVSHILYPHSHRTRSLISHLQELDYDSFNIFLETCLQKNYLEGLISGNYTESDALILWEKILGKIPQNEFPPEEHYKKSILLLNSTDGPYKIIESTNRQGTAIQLLLQSGPFSFESLASAKVFENIIKQPFFTTLRTQQQVAYIAHSNTQLVENQLLHFFSVHSSTHHGDELLARFELFLERYIKDFSACISEENFLQVKEMLMQKLQVPPVNLFDFTKRLHTLAFTYNGDFAFYDKLYAALQELSYQNFQAYINSVLSRNNRSRLAVIIEGPLPTEKDFIYKITDISALKKASSYYSK